ncbi:MAG: MFS transporter [Chloroflexota bacterium]|nr:MFS transporter [Chloroflexota bacterium]NOG65681.1 MFS transporter [Chloroflexota bacterium]GIK63840.1 MAG: MFS transporter [Chloroflexota bacterium]
MNTPSIRLGLRTNWQQFALLVLVNAFVGAMVGLERTLVPQIAAEEFDLASVSVALSFIISFGIVKALTNLFAGRNADRWGRKPLLIAGWLIGLPVPLLVIVAPRWEWIVFANVLLGINQGLCWSTAVIMKIDLVGKAGRGLAMGLNEFAGYLAMALSTVASGWIASQTALRPYPFYMGIVFVVSGLLITLFWVHETIGHVQHEAVHSSTGSESWGFGKIFRQVSWQNKTFFSLSQGGLVNNLNDVVIWGLLPLLALQKDLRVEQAATIGAVYLAVWGSSQLLTGSLSDHLGRKPLITGGLLLQSAGILLLALLTDYVGWLIAAGIMGIGTGMVYPTLLAAVSDVANPLWRASALGVYRLWRDSGYAFGALLGGILADLFTLQAAVVAVGILTLTSSLVTATLLPETLSNGSTSVGYPCLKGEKLV